MKNRIKILIFMGLSGLLCAQKPLWPSKIYNGQLNIIQNSEALNPFFHRLAQFSKHKINIVHIGDSHIQANNMTHVLRTNFHEKFGNAGRGLVFPYELMPSNGHADVVFSSNKQWVGKRMMKPEPIQTVGIMGNSIKTIQDSARIDIIAKNQPFVNNVFDQLEIWHESNSVQFDFLVKSPYGVMYDSRQDNHRLGYVLIKWPKPIQKITIEWIKTNAQQKEFVLHGLALGRSNAKGVVYHSIGANGAEYQHYASAKYFMSQLENTHPDLLIWSLGTNEAYKDNTKFNVDSLKAQLHAIFQLVRQKMPDTPVLITTPFPSMINGVFNPKTLILRNVLVEMADQYQLALWDGFNIARGEQAMAIWKNSGLLRPDGVHFSKEGYAIQGQWLFDAFYKSYTAYEHYNP